MNDSGLVKWGIVGTGRISHQFAGDFEHVHNGKVIAVSSRSQHVADTSALM